MKKTLIALTTSLILSGNALAADTAKQQASRNEAIGFGSGAVTGALIGGPVGFLVGGIFGILIADDVNDEARLKSSQAELAGVQSALQARESELVALNKSLSHYRDKASQLASVQQHIEQLPASVKSNIQFRTASHALEQHYREQLDLVAESLLTHPGLTVSLTGYADQRGDDAYNQALSEQRVISVKQYLIEKGVSPQQVITEAKGENELVSAGQSYEDDFFDRRVVMSITGSQNGMMASNAQE